MKFVDKFHNFSNFQWFIIPRIKIKNLQDFVSTKMCCWRVLLKCQKFLHPSPQKFRQHLRKLDFFSKKNTIFADFEGQFFLWWGCAWSEIFFWGDRHRLGVKPHGRPKSRTGPPQPSVSRFWFPRIEKSHFFILGGKGVRLVRNFFLGWSTLVRSKTSWQTKKTSGTSPAHWESILTSQDRKKAFFPIF